MGNWKKKSDGSIVFEEKMKDKSIVEKTPEQMNLVKSCEFDLYFVKETQNEDEWEQKTRTFFCQHVSMKIRDAYNLWLKLGDNRQFYILDILNGQCLRASFESDSTVLVEKSKPKKTTVEIVKKSMDDKAKPFYFYGMVTGNDSEHLDYGTTVSA